MKKGSTLSAGEELLARILDECLEEDLSFVPPEREIARNHQFSEEFEGFIKELLEKQIQIQNREQIQKHFVPRYGQWVACLLVFCVCGWLFYSIISPLSQRNSSSGNASPTDTAAAADVEEAEWEEDAEVETAETAAETPQAMPAGGADKGSESIQEEQIYCGQTIYLAAQQEVPEALDYVTTLVNCPVLDEENPICYLTIGNIGTESIRYLDRYELEVWLDNGWYLIPPKIDSEGEWQTLGAGMAQDVEIDLNNYRIDYGAELYRLNAYVNDDLISAEFTFTEVFEETMEKLEEETSGE